MSTHFQSLVAAFQRVRDGLACTLRILDDFEGDWPFYDPKQAIEKLMTSSILLEGLLDGLIILMRPDATPPTSFCTTDVLDSDMASIQQEMRDVRSRHPDCALYLDFWTAVDYWKHYYPHTALPTKISGQKTADYIIRFGRGDHDTSGPIMKGLIVPTFNATRQLLLHVKAELGATDPIPDAL